MWLDSNLTQPEPFRDGGKPTTAGIMNIQYSGQKLKEDLASDFMSHMLPEVLGGAGGVKRHYQVTYI